jgi:murein L,D-transpeptidase YcbB/YkuD
MMNLRLPITTATALGLVLAFAPAPAHLPAHAQEMQERAAVQTPGFSEVVAPQRNDAFAPVEPARVEEAAPAPVSEPERAEAPASAEPNAASVATPAAQSVSEPDPQRDALRKLLEARLAEPPRNAQQRRFREAIAAVYEARDHAPLWTSERGWNGQAISVMARLERASDDAIDLRLTPLPVLRPGDAAALAMADLALSEAVANYARQASGGRIDPRSISKHISVRLDVIEPARSLAEISLASDAGAALVDYNPQHRGYRLLRDKLAEVRQAAPAVAQRRISSGPVLRPGMKDERVPLIRARFGLDRASDLGADELLYDTRVAEAVADFQKSKGIPASGTLTARTVDALSDGVPERLEDEIVANMERWRWMPRDMGHERIEVNIPDYTVRVYRGDEVVHKARVIVGKPKTPTPVFSDAMEFLIVNPYWNVPPSILRNEMLPKLREDPDSLRRMGYEVVRNRDGGISVRQPPGERNALGWIKFMFPNEHAVYLHDTPTRHLFANAKRAYSHGCVRVDQPFALAEIVLGEGWTEERVKKLKGGGERTVRMPRPLPIHIGYFSAFVDETGKLQLREDLYGHSQKVKAALGLG